MNDAVKSNRPDGNPPPDLTKRRLITRGGIAAGGLAAFAKKQPAPWAPKP